METRNEKVVMEARLGEVIRSLQDYLGAEASADGLATALQGAQEWMEEDYGRKEAAVWANGFTIDPGKVASDLNLFKASGRDLARMTKRRLMGRAQDRLNVDRIASLQADNPERDRLRELAEGLRIHTSEGFVPNGTQPCAEIRSVVVETGGAVEKMMDALHQQGLVFFLPLGVVSEIKGVHWTEASWAKKSGKAKGRPIMDASNSSIPGGSVLNSSEVREEAKRLFGPIENPTPEQMVRMVLDFFDAERAKDPSVVWEDLVLTKEDLKGAFTLLDVHPESARLLAMRLPGEVAVVFTCGLFGWTGTPFAFNVVTRALQFELDETLRGRVLIYCDDVCGVTLRKYAMDDKRLTRQSIRSLLGPDAVEEDKYRMDRRVEWIGYDVDLDARLFTLTERNFRKTLWRFCQGDVDGMVQVRHAQALASLADRYSCVFQGMRPFAADISSAIWRRKGGGAPPGATPNRSFLWTSEARRAIRFWRAMLCMGQVHPEDFTRTLESFRQGQARLTVEFDGSIYGGGILLYLDGAHEAMGGGRASYDTLGLTTKTTPSAYQNLTELITEILGVVVMRLLGLREVEVAMRGDSVVALAWFREGRIPPTSHGHNAHMLMGALAAAGAVRVVNTEHLPAKAAYVGGKSNEPCDILSRGGSFEDIGCHGDTFVDLDQHPWAQEVLYLCNPDTPIGRHEEFMGFWRRARQLAKELAPR